MHPTGCACAFPPVAASTAFARWFGASKVVDDAKQRLIVFHGTPSRPSESNNRYVRDSAETEGNGEYKAFHAFNTQISGITDSGWLGRGTYFTPDASYAHEFGDFIMPVYVSLQNPFVIRDDHSNGRANVFRFLCSLQGLRGLPQELRLDLSMPQSRSFKDWRGEELTTYYRAIQQSDGQWLILSSFNQGDSGGCVDATGTSKEEAIFNFRYKNQFNGFLLHTINIIGSSEFSSLVVQNGFDGVISMRERYSDESGDDWKINEVVAFEPTQIKSVFNVGAFDPENPDILDWTEPVPEPKARARLRP